MAQKWENLSSTFIRTKTKKIVTFFIFIVQSPFFFFFKDTSCVLILVYSWRWIPCTSFSGCLQPVSLGELVHPWHTHAVPLCLLWSEVGRHLLMSAGLSDGLTGEWTVFRPAEWPLIPWPCKSDATFILLCKCFKWKRCVPNHALLHWTLSFFRSISAQSLSTLRNMQKLSQLPCGDK